jgi:hypothetical protein
MGASLSNHAVRNHECLYVLNHFSNFSQGILVLVGRSILRWGQPALQNFRFNEFIEGIMNSLFFFSSLAVQDR